MGFGVYRRGVFHPALIPKISSVMTRSNFRTGHSDANGTRPYNWPGLQVMLDAFTTSDIRAFAVNSSISDS
jgi:hypothetical protein